MRSLPTYLATVALAAVAFSCAPDWDGTRALVRRYFPEVRQITTADLAAELDGPNPPVLLDTRTADEFAVSTLPGARQLDPDLADPALADALHDLPKDTPIVLFCSVGYRSSATARRLSRLGFTHVANLEGSLFQWAIESRPLITPATGLPATTVHPYDRYWGQLLPAQLRAH